MRAPTATVSPTRSRPRSRSCSGANRSSAASTRCSRRADGFEVVDWKTNKQATADELQLAIYRLAWAELRGIDPAQVDAVFYYVRLGEVKRFDDLPGRAELEQRLGLA